MPSPVGHSLSGLALYLAGCRSGKNVARVLLAFILLTNLPDLDFLPGWVLGQPNLFHRGVSHSLVTALGVGLLVGGVVWAVGWGRFLPAAVGGFVLYATHIGLDLLSVDTRVPRGFAVLWPLSGEHYLSDVGLFMSIRHSALAGEFFPSLLNEENLRAVANEMILFLPLILLLWGLRGPGTRRPLRGEGRGTPRSRRAEGSRPGRIPERE